MRPVTVVLSVDTLPEPLRGNRFSRHPLLHTPGTAEPPPHSCQTHHWAPALASQVVNSLPVSHSMNPLIDPLRDMTILHGSSRAATMSSDAGNGSLWPTLETPWIELVLPQGSQTVTEEPSSRCQTSPYQCELQDFFSLTPDNRISRANLWCLLIWEAEHHHRSELDLQSAFSWTLSFLEKGTHLLGPLLL